jgi:threonine efflux protein
VPLFASLWLGHGTVASTGHAVLACLVVFTMALTWFGAVGLLCSLSPSRRLFAAAGRPLQYAIALGLVAFAIRSVAGLAAS